MPVQKIGFAGAGNMGGALLKGFIAKGAVLPEHIAVVSRSEAGRLLAQKAGAAVLSNFNELAAFADMVILAVKPKDALDVIGQLSPALDGKALLSIVAGLDYQTIHARFWGAKVRTLVTLPNTPVQVGEGVIGFTTETTFTEEEKLWAQRLFESVGLVEWVSEKLLPALSALSGSGPAYAALFAEALADGAVLEGLPRQTACRLAAKTLAGTGRLILETGEHPGMVKDKVCSPGGTTIEGIAVLENGAFRSALINAIRAASEKFKRLLA